jgi:hypothetical protein
LNHVDGDLGLPKKGSFGKRIFILKYTILGEKIDLEIVPKL